MMRRFDPLRPKAEGLEVGGSWGRGREPPPSRGDLLFLGSHPSFSGPGTLRVFDLRFLGMMLMMLMMMLMMIYLNYN